ncbi:uncharacterized protein NECHADRAFT_86008 [Fusarium vanettenii 77-13-4]|uniref:Uncharacterized protein n=1 Tax=Fusarium vanettenii (strain ATCC MYA-4622 / CBS 123669 / FGSC 9596 / NRRL 45880 / 77-13-4) TaxID=660122 RepID=C7Z233_FUSV7|nr:uncharacterized protein NECHADRAFT_86008 [Fusarium vanettenii 77-13-4]EEU42104.1 hypothetical protein NECHADRAFT_86008 [Fusarium vanettenii 77-13-4]
MRENSPRSALIADKVEHVKRDWEAGNYDTFGTVIEEYVPLELMDLAMTTFNLVRIPFQTQRPAGDSFATSLLPNRLKLTNAWNIAHYFTDVFGNWDKFREFLELADKVRQLATAYCYMTDPETSWLLMDRLWNEANAQVGQPVGEDDLTEPEALPRRCVTGIVRRVLMRNLEANTPGQPPKDASGQLVETAMFHEALRLNWEEERGQRSCHLLGLHSRGIIDLTESRALLRQWKDTWTPVNEFHWAVVNTRGISICARLNLDEEQANRLLRGLEWMNLYELGVQGVALCLPQEGEDYSNPRFLAQISRNRREVTTFLRQMNGDDSNFTDGWFQRFPAALPPLQG